MIREKFKDEIQQLKKEMATVRAQLAIMEQRVGELEAGLTRAAEPARSRITRFDAFQVEEVGNSNQQRNLTMPFKRVPGIKINPTETRPPATNGLEQLINSFNTLANQEGYNAKVARDEFVQRYQVRTFNCSNVTERMNDPVPPPKFAEATNGEYWAVPRKESSFLVFPNVKNYSDNYHKMRAMGDVFKSNFVQGETYKKIFVEKPAIFDCNGSSWIFKSQGVLRLG